MSSLPRIFGRASPQCPLIKTPAGRDITLQPRQAGPPLNYFVYPYVEISGKEYSNVSIAFSFSDAGSPPPTTTATR
ncbi:MAG: hypothetical protein ACM34E_16050 [Acidobacteriota bacterium]